MEADEILLELLHAELVNYLCRPDKKDTTDQQPQLSTLEYFGFSAGFRLIERSTIGGNSLHSELETIKFICTDFWASIFKKQIDNLRTNNQGVYVLQDNAFRFLSKISSGAQHLEVAPYYIAFTSGLLRGALANLGINSYVNAEVQAMPECKFTINVHRSNTTQQ